MEHGHSNTRGRTLLLVVEESWQRLDAAMDGLDDARLATPGVVGTWSIVDIVGHVTAWEQLALTHIEHHRRGEQVPDRDGASVDEYNAHEAEKRRGWPLARVREDAAATRARLRVALAGLTDDEWTAPIRTEQPHRTLGEEIGGALSGDEGSGTHAAEHAAEIQAWRSTR